MSSVRTAYLPILEQTSENIIIFEDIAASMKDAVLAKEKDWVLNTQKDRQKILNNLERIRSYSHFMNLDKEIEQIKQNFTLYYKNAFTLSIAMMDNSITDKESNQLIDNVEKYYGLTSSGLVFLKERLQRGFTSTVDEINHRLDRLIFIGVVIGVVLTVFIIGLSFALSLSTRRSLKRVNNALKNMAHDEPDFSARMIPGGDDELGEMVMWFNLLSEKLEKDYQKMEQLSIRDKLTQLYNRTKIDELFQIELNRADRYQTPLSLILIDLDHFKSVNDNYGHLVGDKVLLELALLLKQNIRDADHLGRWGGEEFLIISSDTTLIQARQYAEKLRQLIAAYSFSEVGTRTGSFGVASYHEGDDADSMTKRADDCLYIAKDRGRNTVVTDAEL